MNNVVEVASLFELELDLPNDKIASATSRLIGFETRYQRIHRDIRLLADPEEVRAWSKKHHHKELPVCAVVADRYPLVIFAGDVGTGKTVTAEGVCDRLAREARRDAMLFKLSTRVRGTGKVGEMSSLLNEAFEAVVKQAGKSRHAFSSSTRETPSHRAVKPLRAITKTRLRSIRSSRRWTISCGIPGASW